MEKTGHESPDFKYFYMLRQRTDDFERLEAPYHYYAGKRARKALRETMRPSGRIEEFIKGYPPVGEKK